MHEKIGILSFNGNKTITTSLTAPTIFGSIEGISVTDFTGGTDVRVFYPQLQNAFVTPMKIQEQGIATPNFSSVTLDNAGGIVRKGISDAHIRFTKGILHQRGRPNLSPKGR